MYQLGILMLLIHQHINSFKIVKPSPAIGCFRNFVNFSGLEHKPLERQVNLQDFFQIKLQKVLVFS